LFIPRNQRPGQFARIVSPGPLLIHHVGGDDLEISVGRSRQGDLGQGPIRRQRVIEVVIGQHKREKSWPDVILDCLNVIAQSEPLGLANLRRHVTHVDFERVAGTDGAGDVVH